MKRLFYPKFGAPLVALALMIPALAQAQVTYSGPVEISIPNTFNGVYLDLNTGTQEIPTDGADSFNQDSYTIGYSEPSAWDLNFFFGGIGIAYSETFRPFVDDAVTNHSQILNVAPGTVIGTQAASRTIGVNSFGGSGLPNGGVGESHFNVPALDGSTYSAFTPKSSGYLAFVLNPGASEQYGWMRVTLENDGTPGILHEWAYSSSSSFAVAQVPEARSLLLLALALPFLAQRRSR